MLTLIDILSYLGLPVKPAPKEMRGLVKAYLASLTPTEQDALRVDVSPKTDYAYEVEFLRQVGFTALEASWYAGVGLDTSAIRSLVARRALALRLSNKPYTATAFELIALEVKVLKDMTDKQILKELKEWEI